MCLFERAERSYDTPIKAKLTGVNGLAQSSGPNHITTETSQ